ncbi:uncharacterized protein FSUBG_2925 [Fusarium subglutinans]|uniref:F-box domain-containing protein n=1 Tax=Gibberella subglutinans TaxID=42677 RepID=A0A8H5Q9G4_GIBSU|nr:uncharacterized protein FSUBG_2925 [Fusarium subglutinans]KAF5610664.1 hypothetical protein FSUBG_2925 [Fusarium subglutinans]
MGQLLDLPDEILTYICISISDSDRVGLFQVIHANKRLHKIASPLLVRHWPLHWGRLSRRAHARFAVHLVRNPHLQRNVKSIVFEDLVPFEEDSFRASPGEFDDLAVPAHQLFPDEPSWCEGLIRACIDPVAVLLLALCTRIESLDLTISCSDLESRMLVMELVSLSLKRSGPRRPLGNLQLGMLRWEDNDGPGHIQYAAPFFHLQKLKTLALSALSDKIPLKNIFHEEDLKEGSKLGLDPDIYQTRFPNRTSPIEELILAAACLTSQGLLTVVSSCKGLKKLAFTCQDLDLHIDEHNSVLLKQALLLHAATLEELAFDLEDHFLEDNDGSLEGEPHIGLNCLKDCFQQMEKLKRLTMDIHALYFFDDPLSDKMLDCLPRSLEYLGLECELATDQPEVLRYIEILCPVLEACGPGNRFCALKTLELCLSVNGGADASLYDPLKELAREKGIEFVVTREAQGWGTAWEAMGVMPVPNPPLAVADSNFDYYESSLSPSDDSGDGSLGFE